MPKQRVVYVYSYPDKTVRSYDESLKEIKELSGARDDVWAKIEAAALPDTRFENATVGWRPATL